MRLTVARWFFVGRWKSGHLALLTSLVVLASASAKEVNRCVGPDGGMIFTDRSCSAFQASVFVPEPPQVIVPPQALFPRERGRPALDCPRRIETLEDEVRLALETGDVNHLSALYHWTGASHLAAHSVLAGLELIVRRGVVEIGVETSVLDGEEIPSSLWLEQPHPAYADAIVREQFDLLQNAGCWWLFR